MMRRRGFIGLFGSAASAARWPAGAPAQGAAPAQDTAKVWHIGIVVEGMRSPAYDGFLQGMGELGYVAGKNYLVDWRFSDGRYLRILELVSDFEKLHTDLIFLGDPAMVYPVRQATRTI